MARKVPGMGAVHNNQRRIVVAFDGETFAEIRSRAVAQNVSMGQAIRELTEWGLLDAKDGSA